MIRFTCDGCGKVYSGADELAGQQARCRQCGALFTVGAAQPAARPPARPASSAAPRPKPRTASPAARPARRPAQPLPEAPLPEAEVVSGFSLDLSALGPLDAPALSTASVDLLRPSALGVSTHRRKKKSGALLWLIFGGTGITAVALLAILIILLVDMIGGGSANNPIAYLPSTYTLAASIRVRNLLDRAASVPQIKPQIDEALNNAVSQGFDPRDMQEVFIVIDGLDGYIAAKLSRPVGLSSLPGISSSGESHQGMPIYTMSNRKSANLPIGVSPSMQTMYYVTPSANLLIGATKSERLKEAIDRAKEGRGGRLDLPTGYDLVLRAKTHGVHQSHGGIIASFNRVHGYFVTLRWTDTLSFNADIDTQDAETANMLQQLLTTALQSSRTGLSQQPQAAAAAGILELVHASVSGSQLRVSGSIPTSQLALLPPPSIPAGR